MVTAVGDIVPGYIRRRLRVAAAFAPYQREAAARQDSLTAALLEALQADVFAALDDDFAPRTDVRPGSMPAAPPDSPAVLYKILTPGQQHECDVFGVHSREHCSPATSPAAPRQLCGSAGA